MITLKVKNHNKFHEKSIGLLGKKYPSAIYFQTRFGIHTFFMRFSIDVLILDQNNAIVKMAENLQPNKIFLWPPFYKQVIELPSGELKRNKIKLKDKINLQFV